MHITWKQRLALNGELREFKNWPMIHLENIGKQHRSQFLRNKMIVCCVLSGVTLQKTAAQFNISRVRVSQLMTKCLGGLENERPHLTAALVPFSAFRPRSRKQELPSLQNRSGSACAFSNLLYRLPALQRCIDEMIDAAFKDSRHSQRLSPSAIHGEFKRVLRSLDWPQSEYPYTCKSLAYESLRQYSANRLLELSRNRTATGALKESAYAKHPVNRRAQRAIQIDEHLIDVRTRISLIAGHNVEHVAISRVSIILAVDVDTMCILGNHICYTAHPNQQDMLTLIDNCITPKQNPELVTPQLQYAPGAVFPNALEETLPITFELVQLDNAWMHSANSVVDFLSTKMGATIHYGLAGVPTTRGIVENVFGILCQNATHRAPSTSGSHPTDPIKESSKNAKLLPVVTIQELEEMIRVVLTEYNVTPNASLQGLTPLQAFKRDREQRFCSHPSNAITQQWQPFVQRERCILHWYKDEKRQPYINFMYAKYKGPELIKAAKQEKTQVWVEYDSRDIRSLTVYLDCGKKVGPVYAPRSWQQFPHGCAIRSTIHQEVRAKRLSGRNPLASYFRGLLERRGSPLEARELLRVHSEFKMSIGTKDTPYSKPRKKNRVNKLVQPQPLPSTPSTRSRKSFSWTPSSASHME